MKYKAVIFDIDGTLYDSEQEFVAQSTIDAIHQLKKQGYVLGICTGRGIGELQGVSKKILDLPFDFFILSAGSVAYDKDFELLYQITLTPSQVESIKMLLNVDAFNVDLAYVDKMGSGSFKPFGKAGKANFEWLKLDIPPIRECDNTSVVHIMVCADEIHHPSIYKYLSDTAYFQSSKISLDAYASGVDKINGIKRIMENYQISIDEVVCFGDSVNDIQMLANCGLGICLGNGSDDAKKAATYVCESLYDDGIHKALVKFGIL